MKYQDEIFGKLKQMENQENENTIQNEALILQRMKFNKCSAYENMPNLYTANRMEFEP